MSRSPEPVAATATATTISHSPEMSATNQTAVLEGGNIAHVNFRARCETLGHGEDVFLVQEDDTAMQKV